MRLHQDNIAGGMNTRTSTLLVQPNEVQLARNVNLDQIGAIKKRYGYSTGLTIQADKEILGAFEFVITSSGAIYLLAISNNSGDTAAAMKYSTDFVSFPAHGDSDCAALQKNAKFEFANFIDQCFITGYSATDTTFQTIFTLAGVADGDYDATSYLSGAPNSKYIIQSHDRIFLANTSNSSNELFWSDLPTGSPGAWALTWTSTNNTRIETNDGEEVSGLGKNFNRVLVFKPSSIHKWDADNEEFIREKGNIGCTHHRSIANLRTSTMFYKEGYGFYEYTSGEEPKLISKKIDNWVLAIKSGQDVSANTDENNYYASIGDVTVDGRDYSDVVLQYNSLLGAWTVIDNVDASVIVKFGITDRKTLYFGGRSDGKIYELFSYTTTSTSTSSTSTSSTSTSSTSTSSTSTSTSSTSSTSTSITTI